MVRIPAQLSVFAKDDRGATALEYALIASMFVVAIIASLTAFRDSLSTTLTDVGTALDNANAAN
jgi:pilus assembly protein Flp/PilA